MTTQKFICPAVSVIIPLYNVENYISECLDSLLAQTFQDFEVIVVDDCSTDNSVKVVESYAPKFYGRFTLARMKKKSCGGGSLPRNMGLKFSRAKYIYFMDADDAITATALDELYKIAEEFRADVVHCEKFYRVPDNIWHNKKKRANLKPDNYFTEGRLNVTSPTFLSDDIVNRMRTFAEGKLIWNYWAQFIRRNFIIENSIKLEDAVAQDMILTMCELCCAKKYIIVPNVVYYYRVRENSVTTEKIDDFTRMRKWITVIKVGISCIDKFFSSHEELFNLLDLKYIMFDVFVKKMITGMDSVYLKIPAHALDAILRKELSEGVTPALKAFIFNVMNIQRLQLIRSQRKIALLENELKSNRSQLTAAQKRIAELETELQRQAVKENFS